ncbi:MAG: hypothetical protein APG11_01806 [Candidatus Methanofastidiosum methylothiophilum]|uniref:TiaS-like TCKD domain-containing protein n=1 Tax=Candidatus Methanofastidiosum methylothiophilum TaxID=1705564 RepID=A0A150INP6_9EURY|nr:MAG: hypothetical protein APG11_01806 [Candidatus Methanofastidiosum methylthiophilus]
MKYTRDEFFNTFGNKPWISPFEKIVVLADKENRLIEIFEKHPRGMATASWVTYHYPKASSLILQSIGEGSHSFFRVREGKCDLFLKAGISAAGIEEVKIDKDKVNVTYAGLGGGGVGAVLNRGLAKGVNSVEIIDYGGGGGLSKATLSFDLKQKIVVGVDDTDTKEEGATWSLANEIGFKIENEGLADYLRHTLVQLYPRNPHKTQNCVSTALTFGVEPKNISLFRERIFELFKKYTLSKETGLVMLPGIGIDKEIRDYSFKVKNSLISLNEAIEFSKKVKNLEVLMDNWGLIGAIAALGYSEDPNEAVKL